MISDYFKNYDKVVARYGIQDADTWNFDETGFRCDIARNDWVVTRDRVRRIYSKNPDNRESLTAVECINATGLDIPPMLILTRVNILEPFVNNDLNDDVLITVSESGYSNDYLALQWLYHFDKHSKKVQRGGWRLLIMDEYGSHHTREFLAYCETANIIPFGLPSHTTHLLQPLDVVIFQPLKHWHSEAVNEAMQTGDENFTKIEFLAAFNSFRTKAFKRSTILSA